MVEMINKLTGEIVAKKDIQLVAIAEPVIDKVEDKGEHNDGTYIVDDKGYVPLETLIKRCRREGKVLNQTFEGEFDYDTPLDVLDPQQKESQVSVGQSSDKTGVEIADRQESSEISTNPVLSQKGNEVDTVA